MLFLIFEYLDKIEKEGMQKKPKNFPIQLRIKNKSLF